MTLVPAELPATLQPLVHRALARLAQAEVTEGKVRKLEPETSGSSIDG